MLNGQALAQWHLIDEGQLSGRNRGRELLLAECGLSLGWERSRVREMSHHSMIGNRCSACAAKAASP
jgi:hypothetical protein